MQIVGANVDLWRVAPENQMIHIATHQTMHVNARLWLLPAPMRTKLAILESVDAVLTLRVFITQYLIIAMRKRAYVHVSMLHTFDSSSQGVSLIHFYYVESQV